MNNALAAVQAWFRRPRAKWLWGLYAVLALFVCGLCSLPFAAKPPPQASLPAVVAATATLPAPTVEISQPTATDVPAPPTAAPATLAPTLIPTEVKPAEAPTIAPTATLNFLQQMDATSTAYAISLPATLTAISKLPPEKRYPPPASCVSGKRYGAICGDNSFTDQTGSGACSRHKAVKLWLICP